MFAVALRNITLKKAEKAKIQLDYNGIAGAMLQDDCIRAMLQAEDPLVIEEIIVLLRRQPAPRATRRGDSPRARRE